MYTNLNFNCHTLYTAITKSITENNVFFFRKYRLGVINHTKIIHKVTRFLKSFSGEWIILDKSNTFLRKGLRLCLGKLRDLD